jgi:DNA-binding NarL/FixJ family response regulator
MDLQLPEMGGVEAIRAIRQLDGHARIIVLTMYKGDEDIHRAMDAGASTYLLKDTLADDLPRIVREVHAGRRMLPPDVLARLEERAASPTAHAARDRGDAAGGLRPARQGDCRGAVDQQSDSARAHEEHLRQARRQRPHRGDERGHPPGHHSHRLMW